MAFRLTVSDTAGLRTVRLAGRLGDDAVTPLHEACGGARHPIVLDLSQVTGASNAGLQLLRRLAGQGVHLLGVSQYLNLLLSAEAPSARSQPRPRRRRAVSASKGTRSGHTGRRR